MDKMYLFNKIIKDHSRDITCPWCKAEPRKPCHVFDNPNQLLSGVHAKRNEHLKLMWQDGYSKGWVAHLDATKAVS